MRRIQLSLAVFLVSVGVSACREANANNADADLRRDLQLAAAPTLNLATPTVDSSLLTLEGQPKSAPRTATVLKRGAGNRAVKSAAPTVRAEPDMDVAALDATEVVETVAEAPAPESSEPVAVAPRPTAVVLPAGGAGDYGTAGNGGIFGGGSGSVIRGGGVDGDNCELHRRRGGGYGVPVYGIPRSDYPRSGGSVIQDRTPRSGVGVVGGLGSARRANAGMSNSRMSRTSGVQPSSRPTLGRRTR